MKTSHWRALAIGILLALASAPLNVLAGVYIMIGLMLWNAGTVSGGEGQGIVFSALLFGGPLGFLAGGLLIGGVGAWFSSRLSWPVVIAACVALTLASSWALRQLGSA